MEQRYVIMCGVVFKWEEKEPFRVSGNSIHGAMEFDLAEDAIRCHECGNWFENIATHLRAEEISAKEYKRKHGLHFNTGLISPGVAQRLRNNIKAKPTGYVFTSVDRLRAREGRVASHEQRVPDYELRNMRRRCEVQLPARAKLAEMELGRALTTSEIKWELYR